MSEQNAPNPITPVTRQATWTLLLAKWIGLARAGVALAPGAEGRRWKQSIAPIIGLQAVTLALGELGGLDPSEQALGLDRGAVMIRRFVGELQDAWGAEGIPARVLEMIDDAKQALVAARQQTSAEA